MDGNNSRAGVTAGVVGTLFYGNIDPEELARCAEPRLGVIAGRFIDREVPNGPNPTFITVEVLAPRVSFLTLDLLTQHRAESVLIIAADQTLSKPP